MAMQTRTLNRVESIIGSMDDLSDENLVREVITKEIRKPVHHAIVKRLMRETLENRKVNADPVVTNGDRLINMTLYSDLLKLCHTHTFEHVKGTLDLIAESRLV